MINILVNYYKDLLGREASARVPAFTCLLKNGHLLLNEHQIQLIGEDIIKSVLEFFTNGKLLKQLNATNIALIPKVSNPELASQFRPISCCNVLYKCISKVICHRLKGVMHTIVVKSRSVFVQERSMLHNVLICHEILRHYNRRTTSICLLKIDLRKAYDMMSREFVEEALLRYWFPVSFIHLIMACVTSPMFTVKINRERHDFFAGKRGLRQDDPISPSTLCVCHGVSVKNIEMYGRTIRLPIPPYAQEAQTHTADLYRYLMIFCKGSINFYF